MNNSNSNRTVAMNFLKHSMIKGLILFIVCIACTSKVSAQEYSQEPVPTDTLKKKIIFRTDFHVKMGTTDTSYYPVKWYIAFIKVPNRENPFYVLGFESNSDDSFGDCYRILSYLKEEEGIAFYKLMSNRGEFYLQLGINEGIIEHAIFPDCDYLPEYSETLILFY